MKSDNNRRFVQLLTIFLALFSFQLSAQRMWINEFHYDNTGGDVNEFVELVVEDGVLPADVSIILYDGEDREPYNSGATHALTTFTPGSSIGGFTIYYKNISGIQNADPEPDAIALVYQGVVVEFLSYEGTIVGATGPAAGFLSVDIGVSETDATAQGNSLERTGVGVNASDFNWANAGANTKGNLNNQQNFSDPSLAATLTDAPAPSEPVTPGDKIKYISLANRSQFSTWDINTIEGKRLNSGNFNSNKKLKINTSNLESGTYLLKTQSDTHVVVNKFLKR